MLSIIEKFQKYFFWKIVEKMGHLLAGDIEKLRLCHDSLKNWHDFWHDRMPS